MHRSMIFGFAVLWAAASDPIAVADADFESIDFPTAGGFEARADSYQPKAPSPTLIILFHQAGWSRGEYREIAPKLAARGYRVMAVDQRSGKGVNGVVNETAKRARSKGLAQDYLDAYSDLEAALEHARKKLKAERIIVWGSSYSASLVLRLAAEHPEQVVGVVAFSPGEYFKSGRGSAYVEDFAKRIKQPLFITSSKNERAQVKPIFDASPSEKKILFTPASAGQHGSRALWEKWHDHDVYWTAIQGFLKEYAPARSGN
ncbi:MAG TPA: alpha/beta fold hydrolase [Polyangiales bacterium]|nr:alpha/beta fold hydrolase [Polyangiales bacterium]